MADSRKFMQQNVPSFCQDYQFHLQSTSQTLMTKVQTRPSQEFALHLNIIPFFL
uniref:Uncharacterized protein n=1 Tax=Rhizophora mucronata TaxID=61149 RepID=A0A2P2Q930_RHIMU